MEVRNADKITEYTEKYGLDGKFIIVSSDAHYLTDINDSNNYFELDTASDSPNEVREALFKLLNAI